MSIADGKYVRLTTYTKDGRAKHTAVWIIDLGDDEVGFTSASQTYKVKRIRRDAKVALQPSDARGNVKPGTEEAEGTARVVEGTEFEQVLAKVKEKYGWQVPMFMFAGRIRQLFGKGPAFDCAVIVALHTSSSPDL